MFRKLLPLLAAATLGLAACSGGDAGGKAADNGVKITPYLQDVVMGDAKAPVTVVEYASLTCPHCRDFWKQDFPQLKTNYIDTGKVKYIFRDFPTDPDIAVAGIGIARCKGADNYYPIVDDFFTSQYDIMMAARDGNAGAQIAALAQRHGISEPELRACVDDQRTHDYIETVGKDARAKGVDSTPTVFVNDKKIDNHAYEVLAGVIDHALDPSKPMPANAIAPAEGAATTHVPAPATPAPAAPAPATPAPATPPATPAPAKPS